MLVTGNVNLNVTQSDLAHFFLQSLRTDLCCGNTGCGFGGFARLCISNSQLLLTLSQATLSTVHSYIPFLS
jgi:hypothetical protein